MSIILCGKLIFNKRIKSKMEILDYFQANENKVKDKIMHG